MFQRTIALVILSLASLCSMELLASPRAMIDSEARAVTGGVGWSYCYFENICACHGLAGNVPPCNNCAVSMPGMGGPPDPPCYNCEFATLELKKCYMMFSTCTLLNTVCGQVRTNNTCVFNGAAGQPWSFCVPNGNPPIWHATLTCTNHAGCTP